MPSAEKRVRFTISLGTTVIVGPGFVTVVWRKPQPIGPMIPPHRSWGPKVGFLELDAAAASSGAKATASMAMTRNTETDRFMVSSPWEGSLGIRANKGFPNSLAR